MSLKKILALLALPLVTVFVIAGCASPSPSNNDKDDDKDSSETDEKDDEEEESDAPAEGELAEPGTRVGIDTWLTHSFVSTDDGEALISARLVSVEPVTADQLAFLNTTFDGGELEGYDVWMILVEEKKESGDTVIYNSDYSYFDVVDEDGDQVQEITVIGWDECKTPSFDEAFDTEGAILTQCFLAAAKENDQKPAGVAYVGGYEDGNPYSSYDGKPLYFIKD
jgi:hypothetical protein